MDGAPRKQNEASACVPACHTYKHDPQVSSTLTPPPPTHTDGKTVNLLYTEAENNARTVHRCYQS